MTTPSGEVVPTPDADQPFKIIIRNGKWTMGEHPVGSIAEGKALIAETLKRLQDAEDSDDDPDADD